ncbi:MAG: type II toxin-antitoxin system HicA family toxin [Rudanella sp.]|nr:type II toxin-antitoxin system HicA family toxin [Rudanella sp.]
MDSKEAERLLLQPDFAWVRTKGNHRIYQRDAIRVVIPFHAGKSLHPKIVKEILEVTGQR